MPFQEVAWDIDGTLIDSEPLHQEALMAVVAAHGVDLSEPAPDVFVGVSLPWACLLKRYWPSRTARPDWQVRVRQG